MNQQTVSREKFSTTLSDYQRDLFTHAFFKVNDREIGKDLVQDTFMKTWKYINNGGKIVMMRAFLYHILNNLIIDEYRKRKHKATSLDTLLDTGYEPVTDEHLHVVDTLDGKTTEKLIGDLPFKYQTVIHLHYLEHLSLEEISKQTGQSKNTIAVQIHRGLKKLKILFESPRRV